MRIEEALHTILGLGEQRMAVSSVPDLVKGERVVVLHTLDEAQFASLLALLPESDLPNLWRPKTSAFYRVESIPVLGSGKLDIQGVKRMAESLAAGA
jgi:acyl-[acyl-carrier-protein]-phospholipid O-acyltransferase/long-chain-fatty-acid--[acyl-carrier-protein] ligase